LAEQIGVSLETPGDLSIELLGHAAVNLTDHGVFPAGEKERDPGFSGAIEDDPAFRWPVELTVDMPLHPAVGRVKSGQATLRHENDYTAGGLPDIAPRE